MGYTLKHSTGVSRSTPRCTGCALAPASSTVVSIVSLSSTSSTRRLLRKGRGGGCRANSERQQQPWVPDGLATSTGLILEPDFPKTGIDFYQSSRGSAGVWLGMVSITRERNAAAIRVFHGCSLTSLSSLLIPSSLASSEQSVPDPCEHQSHGHFVHSPTTPDVAVLVAGASTTPRSTTYSCRCCL